MHDHTSDIDSMQRSGKRTVYASLLGGAVLVFLKLYLGVAGRSQALIADGIHSITDLVSDIFAYFGLVYSSKEADQNHPFGHGKIDTLMSMLIGAMMVMAGTWIIIDGIEGLMKGETSTPGLLALLGALASIVIKEGLFQYSYRVGKKIKNQSIIANAWHHRSDAISSIAAAAGIVPILFNPDLYYLDAIAAIVVACLIVRIGLKIIIPAFKSASDIAPDDEALNEMREAAENVEGVISVHDVRARYYAEKIYVEMHVVVDGNLTVREGHAIAVTVRKELKDSKDYVMDAMIHIDPHDDPHLLEK